jgi:hypothetical protein
LKPKAVYVQLKEVSVQEIKLFVAIIIQTIHMGLLGDGASNLYQLCEDS